MPSGEAWYCNELALASVIVRQRGIAINATTQLAEVTCELRVAEVHLPQAEDALGLAWHRGEDTSYLADRVDQACAVGGCRCLSRAPLPQSAAPRPGW